MRKIIALYNKEITEGSSVSFTYKPSSGQYALGLLVTNEVEVSLGFNNGSDLKFFKFWGDSSDAHAPEDKIYPLDEPVEGIIKGVVTSRRVADSKAPKQKVGIYLIVREDEN